MSGMRPTLTTLLTAVALFVMAGRHLQGQGQRIEKPLPSSVTDLQQAQLIEIRNYAGATVLKGTFDNKNDARDHIERKAKLSGVSGSGSAEIEVSRKNGQVKDQELELDLERLLYDAPYKVFLDNKEVFVFSADGRGKASLKLSTKNAK
jgi:hypothetical protein